MTWKTQRAAQGRARFMGRWSTCLMLAVSAAMLVPSVAGAQTAATPEEEYKKLIKVNEDIQPLGDTPFGERISLYDGSLSFSQVDVSVPGTGPTITVGRDFAMHGVQDRPDLQNRAFGDWDMELPQIFTVTARQENVPGWRVYATHPNAICSSFNTPPPVAAPSGDAKRADWLPATWWQGYQLRMPGQGSQDLLFRSATNTFTAGVGGLNYPIVTRGNWAVGCLAQASNDPTLEGFLAVSPDGTKYWLDHIAYRYMPSMTRPLGSSPMSVAASSRPPIHPMATNDDILVRREGRMLVSRIEDRFGNWVTYTYSGDQVTDITASDGRHVTIAYEAGTPRVSSVTVQGGAAGSRTWTYAYVKSAANLVYTLTSVTQPDGSSWGYNLDPFNGAWVDSRVSGGSCDAIGVPTNMASTFTASITHPSGLSASYTVAPLKRGRSYVPRYCESGPNQPAIPEMSGTWATYPNASYDLAITQRILTGAGLATGGLAWHYGYSASNESWLLNCTTACTNTVSTDVTYPDGHLERSTFSNRYDWTETQLKQEDVYDGGVGTALRRSITYNYVNPAPPTDPQADARSTAYAHPWGGAPQERINKALLQEQIPMGSRTITEDPAASASSNTYTWNASAFDAFARATDVQRSSSAGYSVSERASFTDDAAHWVIGLPVQSDNLTTGETVSRNVYAPNSLTLSERYRFGRKVMGYTFDAQGQLASFTDGKGNTTTLGNYKRGIPQALGYPDTTSQSIVVDDFGQITSITNQNGATMSYGYDAIGRVARIDYPAGDTVAWAPKTFAYSFIGDALGMGGSHWMRLVTQGALTQRTDFDVLLRPVMSGKSEANTGRFYVSSRTEYDWKGRKIFESYPVDGGLDRGAITQGVSTAYDALGRTTRSTQSSELGDLTSTWQYLAGAARRVTDPKGNVTTTAYQVFDQPSYDSVIRVDAPEGVSQVISRDVFGNPLSIAQGGITKTMTYDSEHRLCRTWEPESGSEIVAYDNADNVAWSASGQPFNGAGCGYDQVVAAAQTTRGYDAMNRVTSVSYPNGTLATSFTYDALGNPATAMSVTSTSSANNTGTVGWTYGRNKLGLLTAEVLAVDGWSWALGYGYDTNGNLSTVLYPDGETVAYNPNALGQPTGVGGYANSVAYFPDGGVRSYTMGNGALYSAEKNARNLLSNFTYGTPSVLAVSEDFGYDNAGNITAITDRLGSNQRTKSMTYDGLNRLTASTASNLWGTESYTYDTLNNIRTLTNSGGTNTYNYDGNNLLASISNNGAAVHAFQYDARGNTVVKDSQPMNFDLANRLLSIPGKGEYMYDAAGRRVKNVKPGATTYYAYNSAGQLMWQYDPASETGTHYVYLGKKLVANAKVDAAALKPSDVNVTLTLLGPPRLSTDGATVSVTVDIANHGTRLLPSGGRDPVHLGARMVDGAGADQNAALPRANLPANLAPNDHVAVTIDLPASKVIGTPNLLSLVPVQEGVAWFDGWGTVPIKVGPFSSCGFTSTYLCNTEYQLQPNQSASALTLISGPSLSADGQSMTSIIDVANNGTIVLTSRGTHPVNLGSHYADAAGNTTKFDVTRVAVQDLAPGSHVQMAVASPTSGVVGQGVILQYELAQEGVAWFGSYGHGPIMTAVYGTLSVPTQPSASAYTIQWTAVPGAASYVLQEQINGGAWTTVQSANALNWSTSGRLAGTYAYRMQPCATACGPFGPEKSMTVVAIPPAPEAISVPGTSAGSIAIGWSPAPTASRYELEQSINGGGFANIYNGAATSFSYTAPGSGSYTYRVRACNNTGCSGYGPSGSSVITFAPTAAPAISGPGSSNTGCYTINWSGVAGAASYNMQERTNGGGWTDIGNDGSGALNVCGKGNGTYGYQVRACNAGGCGPFSVETSVAVSLIPSVPPAPSLTVANGVFKPNLQVKWAAIAGATRYELLETDDSNPSVTVYSGSGLFWNSGLKYYTGTVKLNLRACNAVGCSAYGPDVSVNLVSGRGSQLAPRATTLTGGQ